MIEWHDQSEPKLPRGYRDGSSIFDETRYSLSLLRALTGLLDLGDNYSEQEVRNSARSFGSQWDEHEFQGLFVLNCPELLDILAKIGASSAQTATPIGVPPGPLIHVVHAVRPILRGHLEVIRTIRTAAVQQSQAVAYFIGNFDKSGDKLDRDNHHGWHYHYCKANGDRSDTILCFDTDSPDRPRVPLFWERHAQGKAKFDARAELWGDRKRKSIWGRTRRELARPFDQFRRPSDEALAVWPKAVVLSPRPQKSSGR